MSDKEEIELLLVKLQAIDYLIGKLLIRAKNLRGSHLDNRRNDLISVRKEIDALVQKRLKLSENLSLKIIA